MRRFEYGKSVKFLYRVQGPSFSQLPLCRGCPADRDDPAEKGLLDAPEAVAFLQWAPPVPVRRAPSSMEPRPVAPVEHLSTRKKTGTGTP